MQTQALALQTLLHLPVKLSPVECAPFYWAEQAGKLPDEDDGNFISREVRQVPQRRRLLTVTSLILLIMLVASLATSGLIEMVRRGWLRAVEKEEVELAKLQKKRVEWQQRNGENARKSELIRIVLDEKPPPVPAWFLGYVSEVVPADLLLTELRVVRTNDAWFVKMAGAAQPSTNSSPMVLFRAAAASMTNKLATGPFHLRISRSVIGEGTAAALRAPNPGIGTNFTFTIEGVIQ